MTGLFFRFSFVFYASDAFDLELLKELGHKNSSSQIELIPGSSCGVRVV